MGKASRNLIAGLLIISCTSLVYAQGSECDQTLSHAETEFNAGHFYSIPSILQKCLNQGLSQEQSVRAYLLLCQAYLIIDDPIAADDSYLKLLRADPEYVADERKDPIDIVYLSKKFTATPIFTPHFRLGFSSSLFRSIYSISTEPYPVNTQNYLRFNAQIGAGIDWNINDNLSLCIEGDFASRAYRRVRSGISAGDEQTLIANQFWLDVPLYLKYSSSTGNIRPFGYAGVAINYLLSSKNTFTYTDNKADGSQLQAVGPSEDVKYQRNLLNKSFVIGGGVKYKWGKDFLYVDLRYMGGLSNMVRNNEVYYQDPGTNPDKNPIGNPDYYLSNNLTRYRYVSDVFRLDNISLSFGFIHPIYDPRRVKKARTKSVSRQIEREEGGIKK